jgi:hypothetical protein
LRTVAVSHTERLALRDNLRTRRLITSPWYRRLWGKPALAVLVAGKPHPIPPEAPVPGRGDQAARAQVVAQALRDNLRTRRLITSPWYRRLWGNRVRLTRDQNRKSRNASRSVCETATVRNDGRFFGPHSQAGQNTPASITRLLINVPPGTMKSLLAGVFWPAWEWGPKNRPPDSPRGAGTRAR